METSCIQSVATSLSARRHPLTVSLAHNEHEISQCQRLRYRVFVDEMGAQLDAQDVGIDRDPFDRYCKHLIVREAASGQIVATSRLLLDRDAARAGGYYSETEFNLSAILVLTGRIMEVGRTCVHPSWRRGAALAMLWHGIARIMDLHRIDYLIGCASIPLSNGRWYVRSVMDQLRDGYFSPAQLRVHPRVALAATDMPGTGAALIPALLKAYLRQGAMVCGEAYYDAAFNVADVFILLDRDRLTQRYIRRFMSRH